MHYLVELSMRVGIIYGGIMLGFLLKYIPKLNREEQLTRALTFFGVNILTPILLLTVMLGLSEFGVLNWWYVMLFAATPIFISYGLDWLLLKRKEEERPKIGAELSAVSFMNALFYPFPIILGLVGTEGLLPASIFLIVNMFLRNSFGVLIGVYYGSKDRPALKKILQRVLFFPPTVAITIGLIIRLIIGKPVIPNDNLALGVFRDFAMVVMLALVGLKFNFPKKKEWREVPLIRSSLSRFGGGIIAVIPVFWLPLPNSVKAALFIQSLAPPAVNNTLYANYFKLDGELTSRLIALLTLIALLLLPIEIIILMSLLN